MTLEVLREEGLVYTQEEQHKVCDSMVFWIHTSSLFTYPKIECCKDTEYSSHTQNVVEVRYYIVSQSRTEILCYHKDWTLSYQDSRT